MNSRCTWALAGLLLSAGQMAAQVISSPPVLPSIIQQTLSTGMVGMTSTQTAQLNVLNLSLPPATTSAGTTPTASCVVELAFYDAQNRVLKQGAATSVAPGNAISLGMKNSDIPAADVTVPRQSIRGLVKTVPPPTTTAGIGSTAILVGSCTLFVTLEIYDSVTGVTQVFTSDSRAVFSGVIVPLTIGLAPAK